MDRSEAGAMDTHDRPPWEVRCLTAADEFAARCDQLRRDNPYSDRGVLSVVIDNLVTELWDRSFSQSEIRSALRGAIDNLTQYAGTTEQRGR